MTRAVHCTKSLYLASNNRFNERPEGYPGVFQNHPRKILAIQLLTTTLCRSGESQVNYMQ